MNSIINEKVRKIKQRIVKNVFNIIKKFINFLKSNYGFFVLILLFSLPVSFFLGKISVIYDFEKNKKQEAVILQKKESEQIDFVASKKGSVYHLPWCPGAIKLLEKNKIFFKTKKGAEKEGYSPAKNCEGL